MKTFLIVAIFLAAIGVISFTVASMTEKDEKLPKNEDETLAEDLVSIENNLIMLVTERKVGM